MDSPVAWITLIVSAISLFIAAASLIIAVISLRRTFKKDEKTRIDLIYEKILSPISSIMHDALVIVNDGYFRDYSDLIEQEEYIFSGFQQLYYFAKVENFPYLAIYASINSNIEEENSKSFAYRFFDLEDNYLRFRKKRSSGKISFEERTELEKYIKVFKSFIEFSSKYTLNILFNKEPNETIINKYYLELDNLYHLVKGE